MDKRTEARDKSNDALKKLNNFFDDIDDTNEEKVSPAEERIKKKNEQLNKKRGEVLEDIETDDNQDDIEDIEEVEEVEGLFDAVEDLKEKVHQVFDENLNDEWGDFIEDALFIIDELLFDIAYFTTNIMIDSSVLRSNELGILNELKSIKNPTKADLDKIQLIEDKFNHVEKVQKTFNESIKLTESELTFIKRLFGRFELRMKQKNKKPPRWILDGLMGVKGIFNRYNAFKDFHQALQMRVI